MSGQIYLFNSEGDPTREGMVKAEKNANGRTMGWSDIALGFLKEFAEKNPRFMAEDVREAAAKSNRVRTPPSHRAWGGVIVRAKRDGIIENDGYSPVKNKTAHRANASVWKSLIFTRT